MMLRCSPFSPLHAELLTGMLCHTQPFHRDQFHRDPVCLHPVGSREKLEKQNPPLLLPPAWLHTEVPAPGRNPGFLWPWVPLAGHFLGCCQHLGRTLRRCRRKRSVPGGLGLPFGELTNCQSFGSRKCTPGCFFPSCLYTAWGARSSLNFCSGVVPVQHRVPGMPRPQPRAAPARHRAEVAGCGHNP